MKVSLIHLAVLRDFAHQYGRNWKSRLGAMWWKGSDVNERHGALLRQIRNELGPNWLASHRIDGNPGNRAADQLAAIQNVEQVAERMAAILSPWEQSKALEWKYSNLVVDDQCFRIGVSTGGVISINGSPHSDGAVILTNHLFEVEIRLRLESIRNRSK